MAHPPVARAQPPDRRGSSRSAFSLQRASPFTKASSPIARVNSPGIVEQPVHAPRRLDVEKAVVNALTEHAEGVVPCAHISAYSAQALTAHVYDMQARPLMLRNTFAGRGRLGKRAPVPSAAISL